MDINILYDENKLKSTVPWAKMGDSEKIYQELRKIVRTKNRIPVPGSQHTFDFLLLRPGDFPRSEGIYDLIGDRWMSGPALVPQDFDPDEAFLEERKSATRIMGIIDGALNQIRTTITDLKTLDQFEHNVHPMPQKRTELMTQLKNDAYTLDMIYKAVWELPEKAKEPDGIYPAFSYSSNWERKNIIFKYLARYDYHRFIYNFYEELKDDPYLKVIDQFISD
jgi:hypothetical protein